jgi:hypothetical protein
LPQLQGTDEGEDHTDQEGDERHDRQGIGSGLLYEEPEVPASNPRSAHRQSQDGEEGKPDEL